MTTNASETVRLLVVSREPSVLRPLCSIGESNTWHLETAGSGWEAMERVQSGLAPHLLLLDLPRGEDDGLHILRWLRRLRPELPIILLAGVEDSGHKKEALRLGAKDFLVRPFKEEQLESAIRQHLTPSPDAMQSAFMSDDIEQLSDNTFFIGTSTVMRTVRAQAQLLAQADVPVLMVGEPGSGRETVARLIHKLSVRSGFKFLKVNCGALPGDLLEREIFGHRGRMFGDSEPPSIGKFELCHRGTIFLDEIVHMPTEAQEKLLQLMQTKRLVKAGLDKCVDVDVRVLAATSANIERALSGKTLREDLYYRLSAFTVRVPALRERRDEIPFLLQHFMHKLARHYSLPPREFSPAVLEASQRHSWPGNVRELEEFVKRYLMIGDGDLTMGWSDGESPDIQSSRRGSPASGVIWEDKSQRSALAPKSLKSLIESVKCEAERNAIVAALEKTGGNRKAAARLLKVSYRTILYKMVQHNMRRPETSSASRPKTPRLQGVEGRETEGRLGQGTYR